MPDTIDLAAARAARAEPEYDGLVCECGSAWFTVQCVALNREGSVTSYYAPVTCRECGAQHVGGAWVPPDLTVS